MSKPMNVHVVGRAGFDDVKRHPVALILEAVGVGRCEHFSCAATGTCRPFVEMRQAQFLECCCRVLGCDFSQREIYGDMVSERQSDSLGLQPHGIVQGLRGLLAKMPGAVLYHLCPMWGNRY